MVANAVNIIPEPRSLRQLGDEGLVVFWRDGREPGRRQGLACTLSMCPHPECACGLVYVDGFVIDEQATAISWDEDGVHVTSSCRFTSDQRQELQGWWPGVTPCARGPASAG
jgi:hypothetical protein